VGWTWAFAVDRAAEVPLAVQIERAVMGAVRDGRLRAGSALPSTRALAGTLGVTRNTAVAAYRELAAQGWIEARPGGRTTVAATLPDPPRARPSTRREAPYAIAPQPEPRTGLALRWPLGAGEPDLRLVPAVPLARAMRRALSKGRVLGYRDPRGLPEFLDGVRDWLGATRGVATDRSRLLSTHGAQHALDLVARALLRPGDRVAVEALGYAPAWRVFDLQGAVRVPLPVDGDGVRVDALEDALRQGPIRLVYVTPHHQYPTTATLSPARRMRLLALARAHRFAILEDDYDHELFQHAHSTAADVVAA
jgi:GntR family transcriptional regulator / MocR family aminotransferase